MLTPCSPCSCPGAPCEQCMFGYQSAETNHDTMKKLIERTLKGEKPHGHSVAERYMNNHKNWQKEMELEIPKTQNLGKLQTGILIKCARCKLEKFFPDKNSRGDSDSDVATSGWSMIDGRHVCPDCNEKYKEYMRGFWEEE